MNNNSKQPKAKTAQTIDGKTIADQILADVKIKAGQLQRAPGLAVILIGDDPASALYVRNKKLACHKVDIEFHEYRCGADTTEPKILEIINWLNDDDAIDGIIIQLPLPSHLNTQHLINQLNPIKDVDGFHPHNAAEFLKQGLVVTPPLIDAIQAALNATQEPLVGKKIIIIAKNPILTEPLKETLSRQQAEVTIIQPNTTDFAEKLSAADVIISIVGQPKLITKDMIKTGAIIIDAGTNMIGEKQWVGDADPAVAEKASWLTPVPGGIGPLTVAMLIKNTFEISQRRQG